MFKSTTQDLYAPAAAEASVHQGTQRSLCLCWKHCRGHELGPAQGPNRVLPVKLAAGWHQSRREV